jgi:endonuclease-8
VVLCLETVGKHMLIRMSDGTTLRIHLKMTGSWHRYDPGESWSRSRGDLALALETREHQVVCFKAPDVERIDERALANHPILAALGRDLMAENADLDEVLL